MSTPGPSLQTLGVACALGVGREAVARGLFADAPSGVASGTGWSQTPLPVGEVREPLAGTELLPPEHRSRNNALMQTALEEIRDEVEEAITRFGPHRIGVVLGTSTSGIGESEAALEHRARLGVLPEGYHLQQQELGSPSLALSAHLGLRGPAWVISTACSSSAKALISAARLLQSGMCDAVITGGVDTLTRFTVAGFGALASVSSTRCNPLSLNRDGINLGEAAALFLMTRERGPVQLRGFGESSDAHHISAPEPGGRGARASMEAALSRAGLAPADIGYVNLHGTATPQNDAMESRAVHALFGEDTPCSSTKPLTGHTLGAAGALEAAICWLTLTDADGRLPPHWWDGVRDPALPPLSLVQPGARAERLRHVLSNSFAFGGSNATLILERIGDE